MKRLASMQPYFFPYIGYWQLIAAVDCFELFDTAQYMRRGWVNRNRIIKPPTGWQYFHAPVAKHPVSTPIREVRIAETGGWKTRIINQLTRYKALAPYFDETMEIVEYTLFGGEESTIGALNCRIIRQLSEILSIRSEIVLASDDDFDYGAITCSSERTLAMVLNRGATEFVNPVAGISLLDTQSFARSSILLSAYYPPSVGYYQAGHPYEPSLSIVDVLMFNGVKGTTELLSSATILPVV